MLLRMTMNYRLTDRASAAAANSTRECSILLMVAWWTSHAGSATDPVAQADPTSLFMPPMLPVTLRHRNCMRMYVMGLQPGFSSGLLIGCPVGPVVSFMLTLSGYCASGAPSGKSRRS
jgi:hypothetical protein